MGYYLYITRRKNHSDEEGPSITEDEWRELVESDPELSFSSDGNIWMALWDGQCKYPDPWFAYDPNYGSIDTKNPDEPIIEKMIQMATRLKAKVQGDDCEVYRSPSDFYFEDDEELPKDVKTHKAQSVGLPWWKRLLGLS